MKPEPCIAYSELARVFDANFPWDSEQPITDRLEWLLTRHNTDGRYGCDWCVLAEEIRRLRAVR